MGVVHEAVENRVGEGRVADHVVPRVHGELAGDDGCLATVAVVDDLEQVPVSAAVSFRA